MSIVLWVLCVVCGLLFLAVSIKCFVFCGRYLLRTKRQMMGKMDEVVWAQVFHDTIAESSWLVDKTFSPGRWALGYPALYALYRALNEFRPKRILELGLGQSTRMITQYVATDAGVSHKVVEHDYAWIDFYKKRNRVASNTEIVQLDREFVSFKEAARVCVFKGFRKNFEAERFDFIVIDAPLSGDGVKKYSRVDILSILPQCLESSFVIILDDINREPEQRTAAEINRILDEGGIEYVRGEYRGEKGTYLWASKDMSFLSSL